MASERPAKRVKLLSDDEGSDSDSSDVSGVDLQVNQDFARRFEHNKKRAERHRLEEKYGNGAEDSESSSSDEEEDDNALLASGALDQQFQATLKALRSKDPSIYKQDIKFYDDDEEETAEAGDKAKSNEKPMYLTDYHRQNLLSGRAGREEEEDNLKPTFAQEQEAIKRSVIREMHDGGSDEDMEDDEFLIKKRVEMPEPEANGVNTAPVASSARDDPEAFLDDFLSRRAWEAKGNSNMQAFESDDEEFDRRAEDFEQAYNLRFEDPELSKGKLVSHARDIAAKYSVRQDETNRRQKAREKEKSQKDLEREERRQEKARLKKLKLDEAEERLKKIKQTAGLKGREFKMEDWSKFLTGDWDDKEWEKEFEKRFGDDYYDEDDAPDSEVDGGNPDGKKRKPKKPKFEDDIDIKDLIPEFEEDEHAQFSITDDEAEVDQDEESSKGQEKKSKNRKKEREEAKRDARRDRRKLEALVNDQVDSEIALDSAKGPSQFRYRETSPTRYGLSASEILLASDAQLNSLVGLKKLATFRDQDKKRKDKKRLGKKARLRQWRKDTFGNEQGPQKTLQDVLQAQDE